jgi:hypothetical protein
MSAARNCLTGFGLPASNATSTSYSGESLAWESILPTGGVDVANTVVVDLGASASMGAKAASTRPRILILTHDDSDHIGGAAGFAAAGGFGTLSELWVPFEWSILTVTLLAMSTVPVARGESVSTRQAAAVVRDLAQADPDITRGARDIDRRRLPYAAAAAFAENLDALTVQTLDGADDLDPAVVKRVQSRASALMKILAAADEEKVTIRYFSVDRAKGLGVEPWSESGEPGVVTLANALEQSPPAVSALAPTILSLYAVIRLTIQNRRALCPVLWHGGSLDGAVIVWSDSSGEWLADVPAFTVLAKFAASTAPHHGSVNPSHDAIWKELRSRFPTLSLPMLCLGGSSSQNTGGVRAEYAALPSRGRACTRCRHTTIGSPLPPRDAHDVALEVTGGRARVSSGLCAW